MLCECAALFATWKFGRTIKYIPYKSSLLEKGHCIHAHVIRANKQRSMARNDGHH